MRILLIWKYVFQKTYDNGIAMFGKSYMRLRHEDLCHDPVGTVKSLYDFLGRQFSPQIRLIGQLFMSESLVLLFCPETSGGMTLLKNWTWPRSFRRPGTVIA